MIIRDRKSSPAALLRRLLIPLGILMVPVLILIAVNSGSPEPAPAEFFSNAEFAEVDGDRTWFRAGSETLDFLNGHTKSADFARSGDFSSKTDNFNPYGLGFETTDLVPGELIEVEIWVHSPTGMGELVAQSSWGLYQSKKGGEGDRATTWEKVRMEIPIPNVLESDASLKIFAFNPEVAPAYWDDMSIRKVRRSGSIEYPEYTTDSMPAMNLVIDDKGLEKLQRIRLQAMESGIYKQGTDDWVKGRLETNKERIPAKLRLKGDWSDHLRGEKWSFRIQTKSGYAWNRLTTFSVQNPQSRSFLDEWVYHKLLLSQDVLAPRYDFLNVKLNGKSLGIYAWEEHFVKQLPEFNKRREGPIVKFNETGFWDVVDIQEREKVELLWRMPVTEASVNEPFKEGKTLGDSALRKQFLLAQNLLYEYRYAERPPSEIFDIDKMAKYIAMIDLTHAHHGFIWHNQRFYYNPVTAHLEPIGFDGYTGEGALKWIQRPFIGFARNIKYLHPSYKENMFQRFFLDRPFLEKYIQFLLKFTDPEFITQFLRQLEPEIALREKLIQKEYPDYNYDRNKLSQNAKEFRRLIFPFRQTSVKAHYEGKSGGLHKYKVFNWHCLPVDLIGLGPDESQSTVSFREAHTLPAYGNHLPPDFIEVLAQERGQHIFFSVPGIDSVFSAPVVQWDAPMAFTPEQELFENAVIEDCDLYKVEDNEIHFRPGKHTVDRNIIIPQGYVVRMTPGTHLDFVNKAKFISKSVLYLIGSEEDPILITSSDQTANGFTVLQVWEDNVLRHVNFSNFKNLDYKGWTLTGAVTFYESKVQLTRCTFADNHCEDGLNLVRCNFNMEQCLVTNTPFDGFDADFCEGRILNTTFRDTGNDGMDFSGSKIWVTNSSVQNSKDKALSAGEESTVKVISLTIDGAVLGIASKDLSKVNVNQVSMKNVQQGFAAYRKKPEYGPATIAVEKYKGENVETLHLIEEGSRLELEGKMIEGSK